MRRLEARLSVLRYELRAPFEEEALRADSADLLACWVGVERVAFLVESITEVVPMPETRPLPEAPLWITGILDLRGQLIAVIDVEARIKRTTRIPRASDFVIISTHRNPLVALVVHGIQNVTAFRLDQLVEPPPDVPLAPYVLRVARSEQGTTLLLTADLKNIGERLRDIFGGKRIQ